MPRPTPFPTSKRRTSGTVEPEDQLGRVWLDEVKQYQHSLFLLIRKMKRYIVIDKVNAIPDKISLILLPHSTSFARSVS